MREIHAWEARLTARLMVREPGGGASPVGVWAGAPEGYSEARWRFGGWVYAVGQGGTPLFPSADGTSRPGAFASLGLGVDHAR
jgi:hypothetical protein